MQKDKGIYVSSGDLGAAINVEIRRRYSDHRWI